MRRRSAELDIGARPSLPAVVAAAWQRDDKTIERFEARVLPVAKMGPANVLVPVICHTQWAVSSDAACSV